MQTYEQLVSGTTTFGQLYGKINNLVEALRSAFNGTAFPTTPTPVEGQLCYRTDEDKLYVYVNTSWVEIGIASSGLGLELINARGTKPNLDQRLDVALNEDGTLKASTTLNPSQWYLPSLTFTYVSTTSFTVNGDQTDIYKKTRRLKINLTGSAVYSEVVSATYSSPNTTIIINDAVLNNTLVSVEHSLFLPTKDNGALSLSMLSEKIKTITGAYNTTLNDDELLCDALAGAFSINILSAAAMGAGKKIKIKKKASDYTTNAITLTPAGSETIDGFSSVQLTRPGESIELESDGTNLIRVVDETSKLFTSDVFSDFVISGLLGTDPGATLSMTTPGGIAYINGKRVVKPSGNSDLTYIYTASQDTYDYLRADGAIVHQAVANGAGEPTQPANTVKLQKVITNATEITAVTDMRTAGRMAWERKPAFRGVLVYNNANQTIITATSTFLTFNLEIYDTDNIHDNSINTSRLIVPTGVAKVRISAFVSWELNATGIRATTLYKNGSLLGLPFIRSANNALSGTVANIDHFVSPILNVAAGDYFELSVYHTKGADSYVEGNSSGRSSSFAMEIIE